MLSYNKIIPKPTAISTGATLQVLRNEFYANKQLLPCMGDRTQFLDKNSDLTCNDREILLQRWPGDTGLEWGTYYHAFMPLLTEYLSSSLISNILEADPSEFPGRATPHIFDFYGNNTDVHIPRLELNHDYYAEGEYLQGPFPLYSQLNFEGNDQQRKNKKAFYTGEFHSAIANTWGGVTYDANGTHTVDDEVRSYYKSLDHQFRPKRTGMYSSIPFSKHAEVSPLARLEIWKYAVSTDMFRTSRKWIWTWCEGKERQYPVDVLDNLHDWWEDHGEPSFLIAMRIGHIRNCVLRWREIMGNSVTPLRPLLQWMFYNDPRHWHNLRMVEYLPQARLYDAERAITEYIRNEIDQLNEL